MIYQVVAIYDTAAETYGRPAFVAHKNQAIRSFRDEVLREDSNNDLHKHPEDFILYHLGSFDDNNAKFTSHPKPELLIRGLDIVNIVEQQHAS